MLSVSIGVAAADAIRSSRTRATGTVIATFEKAVYLRFSGGIVVLTAPSVPLGPLHVSSPVDLTQFAVGDTFTVPDVWLHRATTIWRGELPDPSTVPLGPLRAIAQRSALLTEPLVRRWEEAAGQDNLAEACRLLGGLGPGMTPSGDDALAGMLLAARLRRPDGEEYLVSLAGQVDTHEIARAFLTWAARGQSIEPVHRLLAGDATAAADLLAFGHTSGADLALGLWHGLTTLTAPWRETPWSAPPLGC